MFKEFKNIDTAFKHVRLFTIFFLCSTVVLTCYVVYRVTNTLQKGQAKVYVLANGKLMDALGIDRSDALIVELRDHIKMFHYYFFGLEPDDKAIKAHLLKASYLADSTAKREFNNLTENGYYSGIISGNISQQVLDPDSIQVNIDHLPYYFKYYGKLRIVRSTSVVMRSLITEGFLRTTAITDNDPHGFLIEQWRILENKDL